VDGQVPVARKAEATAVSLDQAEPLSVEAEHFVTCIRDRTAPLTDGASGARVLHILDAGERSLRQGGAPVTIGERSSNVVIHPTASVDRGAVIGERTRVWHHSHVMAGARIGSDCMLGQNSFVADGVLIGNGVHIQNNVSVYRGVELEDDVFCGPSAVFTNVDSPRSELSRNGVYERTLVRRGATIGANATVVCGVTIGRYALVAAGAVVTADVADHALVMGVPARFRGWRCRCRRES